VCWEEAFRLYETMLASFFPDSMKVVIATVVLGIVGIVEPSGVQCFEESKSFEGC